ncbi:hypothetical protein GOBAR_AA16297 [Gossypium barbadense]|uniref:Tripeptidyl peptidase II Ig-like domain-containing protein n=1 Tax=Gossypium barbadense TaxID=3634 RepID=A0A2P5XLZ1_GOSBA|nr:hypothetical protein GOBAR_AA16297 [Gossypium barbadense]
METSRDQLAQALYQKGLALAEIETLKGEKASVLAAIEGTKDSDQTGGQSAVGSDVQSDLFEENFKELTKWVDLKSSKYGTLSVMRERRCGRLGTALKVVNEMIQDDGEPPKKKLYELKLSLLDEIGWSHLSTYERQWMHLPSHTMTSMGHSIVLLPKMMDMRWSVADGKTQVWMRI